MENKFLFFFLWKSSPVLSKACVGKRLFLFAIGLVVVFLATGGSVVAQTGKRKVVLPPVDFGKAMPSPLPEDITGTFQEKTPPISLDNPYLKDALTLQHQIGLLERLIERQTVISQIESAYSEIGLPFHPSPPPREICAQLPASVACSRGYPDLYGKNALDISMDLEDLLPEIPSPDQVPATALIPPGSEKESAQSSGTKQEEKIPEKYNWAEVSCAGERCKAVLVEVENPAVRKTVAPGDVLSDGSVVSAISFDGVLLSREGKAVPLEPAKAPSRGGPSSPVLDGIAMSGAPSGNGASAQAAKQPMPSVPMNAAPSSPVMPKGNSPESAGSPTP